MPNSVKKSDLPSQEIASYIKERGLAGEGELHYRRALENLLNALIALWGIEAKPKHEKTHGRTAPDYTLEDKIGETIGIVECKKPGGALEIAIEEAVNKDISPNILITDYWHFWLLDDREIIYKASLPDKPTKTQKEEFARLIRTWMDVKPPPIKAAAKLSEHLAWRCRDLRDAFADNLSDKKIGSSKAQNAVQRVQRNHLQ